MLWAIQTAMFWCRSKTWFQAMELAMEARLPTYPTGGPHTHVNLPAPICNCSRFFVHSDSYENNMAKGLIK